MRCKINEMKLLTQLIDYKNIKQEKIEKQEVDKNISELKEQKEILNLQQLAMTLKIIK